MGTVSILRLDDKYDKATTWQKKERLLREGWTLIARVTGWDVVADIPKELSVKS